ncbi:MAG: right-handed parallel beta-helix repeat-containing protein [Candidatus Neomarinimicrobiota bacterium]
MKTKIADRKRTTKKFNYQAITVFILACFILPVAWGQLPNEIIDKTFDGDGLVTTNLSSGNDVGYASVIQPDGKIVVAGKTSTGTGDEFVVARYNQNGSLDNTFGTSGYVTTDVSSVGDEAWAVALQSDGKIVVAGYSKYATWCEYGVVRYNSDGSLDTSFDSDGIVTTSVNVGSGWGYIYSVAIQEDGKIIIAGSSPSATGNQDITLVRYNSNGSLDTSFDTDGIVTANITGAEVAHGIAIQADGKIVVGGYSSTDKEFLVLRYNNDGLLDTGFGSSGIFETSFGYGLVNANALALQEDGKIILVGSVYTGTNMDCATVRFTTAGALDNTFDGDGLATVDFNNGSDYGEGVAVQGDGKIVVAAAAFNGSAYKFGIVRYLTNGSLDQGFADYGKKMTSLGTYTYEDWPHAVSLQDDGKIVVAGHSTNGSDDDFSLVRYTGATMLQPDLGNEYTDGQQGIPLSTTWEDLRHQSLYLASELTAVGIPAWSKITAIEIIPSTVPAINLDNFRVAYNTTANTSFNDFINTNVIYGPINHSTSDFTSMEWFKMDIEDVVWNGTDNLVFEFSHDNSSYSGGGGVYLRQTNASNRVALGYTDSYNGPYPFVGLSWTGDTRVVALRVQYEPVNVLSPSNLVLTAGDSKIDLDWDVSNDGDLSEYLIFRGTTANNLVRIDSVNSGTTTYTDSDLNNGTTYYYGVKAKNSNAELSEFTNIENAIPEYAGPKNITVANSDTRVTLNWEAPGGTLAAYYIYRGTAANPTTAIDSIVTGSPLPAYYFDDELENNTAFYYRLRVKFGDGSYSSYSPNYIATPGIYALVVDGNIGNWADIRPIHNDPVGDAGYADIDSVKFNADGFYLYGAVVTNSDLSSDLLDIYFDTDFNASTGMPESGIGADYKLTISPWGTDEFLFRNEFNNWKADGDADFNVVSSNGNCFHEFSIHLDELDGPDSLRFYLSTSSGDKAPNTGYLVYQMDPNDAPRKFFAATGDTKASLNWAADNSSGYAKYLVYRGAAVDPTSLVATITGGTPLQSFYLDTDLTNGQTYYYRVRAQYSDDSYSDYTENILVKPNIYSLPVDGLIGNWTNIRPLYRDIVGDVDNADIDSVKIYASDTKLTGYVVTNDDLVWGEVFIYIDTDFNSTTGSPGNNIGAEYQLRISLSSGDVFRYWSGGNWQESGNTDFSVVHSNSNRFHEFSVSLNFLDQADSLRLYYQTNYDGYKDYAPEDGYYLVYNTTKVAPDAPTGLTTLADSAQVTLRWSANDPAKLHKYNIYRGTSIPATTLIDSLVAASPPDTVYLNTGLVNGTTYYFAVSAVDSTGRESERSKEVMSTPNRYHEQLAELLLTNTSFAPENDAGYPFSTTYSDVKHQSLYWAQDFSEAGIPAGAWFSSLELKPSTVTIEIKDFRLALGATNDTELSNFVDLEDSVVHGPTTYNQSEFTDDSWKRFGITPYQWDGASNMILEASQDGDFWFSNPGGVHIRQVDGTRGRRGGNDYSVYPFGNMSWTAPEDKVLALRIAYSPIEPVSNFTATPGHQQIYLTWTAPQSGTVAEYIVYSGTSTSTLEPAGTTTGTSFTVTGLTNQTLYYVGVQVKSSIGEYSSVALDQVMPAWIGPNWYVDAVSGVVGAEGSPEKPVKTIRGGIAIAGIGDTVLVLPGTYKENNDQYIRFAVDNGSGGYAVKNLVLKSRDGTATTIIDGEYTGTSGKRLFEIIDDTDTTTQVVGFTIKNGYSTDSNYGSAITVNWNSEIVFKNCIIENNRSTVGSAIRVVDNAQAWFRDCIIRNNVHSTTSNWADIGAIFISNGGDIYLNRCQVINNSITSTSSGARGAGVYIGWSDGNKLRAVNTLFAGNTLSGFGEVNGSALYVEKGDVSLINCTIANNQSQQNAIVMQDGYLTIFNSIIYGNIPAVGQINVSYQNVLTAISYSLIQNENPLDFDGGMLNVDPEFTSGYALHDRSLAIGRGALSGSDAYGLNINAPTVDLAGSVRPNPGGSNPDMGVYENVLAITPYPAPPKNLDPTPLHKAVYLVWNMSDSTDVVKYYVYQSNDSTNWAPVDTVTGRENTQTVIPGLTNKTSYWFAVTSVDGDDYESSKAFSQRVIPEYQGPVWYVDAVNGALGAEGSSEQPMRRIKEGITRAAISGDTVLVLPGRYREDDDQYLNFAYDSNSDGNYDGPKNIVLLARGGSDSTHIDGEGHARLFEFTHGQDTTSKVIGFHIVNAGANGAWQEGSAITINNSSKVVFRNCVIDSSSANETPAVFVSNSAQAWFSGSTISDNENISINFNDNRGGAIAVASSGRLYLNRCSVINNNVTTNGGWARGGAIYLFNESGNYVRAVNCVIADNTANSNGGGGGGGAIYAETGEVRLINATVVNNSADDGAALWLGNGIKLTIFNSIVYNNEPYSGQLMFGGSYSRKVTYSILEGVNTSNYGIGVFNEDPKLDGYALSDRSPAIGAGAASSVDNTGATVLAPTVDITGAARPQPTVSSPDLGAYENIWNTTPYPDPVSGLTVTARDERVLLNWDASTHIGLSHYVVYQSTLPGFMPQPADSIARVEQPATGYTAGGLTNGTTYYYLVSAVDTAGRASEFLNELNATPNQYNQQIVELLHTNPASNPTNDTGYPFNTGSFTDVRHQSLYWQEDLLDAGIPANAWITGIDLKPSAITGQAKDLRLGIAFPGLTMDEFYSWQNVNIVFGPRYYDNTTLTANQWERFNVNAFQWTGTTNWLLEYTHDNDFTSGSDGGAWLRQVNSTRGRRGAVDGWAYPFVGGMNDNEDDKVLAVRLVYSTLAPVTALVTDPGHRQVTLSWNYTGTADKYLVYSGPAGEAPVLVDSTTGTTITISDLTNGNEYVFAIQVKNGVNYSGLVTIDAVPKYEGPVWYVDIDAAGSGTLYEGSIDDPATNIRSVILNSNNGDTILVKPGTYSGNDNRDLDFQEVPTGMPAPSPVRSLVLMGEKGADSTIIDLSGAGVTERKLLLISSNEGPATKIQGLTVINGSVDHGVIDVQNGNLTIEDCVFRNNNNYTIEFPIVLFGGINAMVRIDRCLFTGNTSGSAGVIMADRVDIRNSIFYNNSARVGAAIYWDPAPGKMSVINCLFLNNTSNESGGAMYISPSENNYSVVNSIFWDNVSTTGYEPDIADNHSNVHYCVVKNPERFPADNFGFDPQIPGRALGDFSLTEYSPAIGIGTSSYFDYFTGGMQPIPATDYLGNARPRPEESNPDLGPIEHDNAIQRYWVYQVATTGNDANDGITAPFKTIQCAINQTVDKDTIEVAAGTYSGTGNFGLDFSGRNIVLRSANGPDMTIIDGGPAFSLSNGEPATAMVIGFTLQSGNVVDNDGGAIQLTNAAAPTFRNLKLVNNTANGRGGAIFAQNSTAKFINCLIIQNNGGNGGAAYLDGGAVEFIHCTIADNNAQNDVGIASRGGNHLVLNSILWNNYDLASEIGPDGVSDAGITVEYSNVLGGYSGDGNISLRPGFVNGYKLADWSPMIGKADTARFTAFDYEMKARTVSDTTWPDLGAYENAQRTADLAGYSSQNWYVSTSGNNDNPGTQVAPFMTIQRGTDFVLYADTVFVQTGNYQENITVKDRPVAIKAPAGAVIDGGAGGTVLTCLNGGANSAYFEGLTIRNGLAGYGGGVRLNNTSATFDNCAITGNTASSSSGGGLWAYTNDSSAVYTLNLIETDITGNSAPAGGAGGFSVLDYRVTIRNCEISANSASGYAGFVLRGGLSDMDMSDCRIVNNQADQFGAGGGITNSATAQIAQTLISGNVANLSNADWYSGGLSVWDAADVDIVNCTFADNVAHHGGGLTVGGGGIARVSNSIFWGNTPDQIALDEWSTLGGNLTISYSIVEGGDTGIAKSESSNLIWAQGNRTGDPAFRGDDYGLLARSAAINGGHPDSTDSDGTRLDMGYLPYLTTNTEPYWHVDAASGSDEDGQGTAAAPFASVQAGVNFAVTNDTVLVAQGNYLENVEFRDYDLALIGEGYETVIDGGGSYPAVAVMGTYFTNATLIKNLSLINGSPTLGNLHVIGCSPVLENLWLREGQIGLYTYDGNPTLNFCLLTGNSEYALAAHDGFPVLVNTTIAGNQGGVSIGGNCTVTLRNSIVSHNVNSTNGGSIAATYSDIRGLGLSTNGNIDADPLFVDSNNGDYSLRLLSPCVDTGDPADLPLDPDGSRRDMGALPLFRIFVSGPTDGNIEVDADSIVVINGDVTISSGDSLIVSPGATLYMSSGVTVTIEGILKALGQPNAPIRFVALRPGEKFKGIILQLNAPGLRAVAEYSYLVISDVADGSVPLTVNGDAIFNHITIAGNDLSQPSLVANGTVALNYSLLESSIGGTGTVTNTGSIVAETDHLVDPANGDFNLVATSTAIDVGAAEAGTRIDLDYSYTDAGAYYHDQSAYPVDSAVVIYPAFGETILVSPDTSSITGVITDLQLFNEYGRYKTNATVAWAEDTHNGYFPTTPTNTTSLEGIVSNTFLTNTVADSPNWYRVNVDGVLAQSGVYMVVPGVPDSVLIFANADTTITQLDTVTIAVDVHDQFSNLVSDGETVNWTIQPVTGNVDGFYLVENPTTTVAGIATVQLATNPNSALLVGDGITVQAESNSATLVSRQINVITDQIFMLTLDDQLTQTPLEINADLHQIELSTTLVDTFGNPLSGVDVNWSVTGTSSPDWSFSSATTQTDFNGVATTTLTTGTVSGYEYQVISEVTGPSLVRALRKLVASRRALDTDILDINLSLPTTFKDLDDTTAAIVIVPGAPNTITADDADTVYVVQSQVDTLTINAWDAFGNLVSDGSVVDWNITSEGGFAITSQINSIGDGTAELVLAVDVSAVWLAKIDIDIEVHSVFDASAAQRKIVYIVEDYIAPAAVTNLAVAPAVWTSTNDFTLTWTNPNEHSGVAGAHFDVDEGTPIYVTDTEITTLTGVTLPANEIGTIRVWLQDNADNSDVANAVAINAKWDNTPPAGFGLLYPANNSWMQIDRQEIDWNASSDATAGLKEYRLVLDGNPIILPPDVVEYAFSAGPSEGSHIYTVFAVDSAGNETQLNAGPITFNVDFTAPAITHNQTQEGNANQAVTIAATFQDPASGVVRSELYYRKGGEMSWQSPVNISSGAYSIASAFVTSAGVEYYLEAEDLSGNIARRPASGFYSISVTISGSGLSSTKEWPTGVPNGTSVASYQLISFPGLAANNTPTDILVNAQASNWGAYNNTKWRFYSYSAQEWVEFAGITEVVPGAGYFLIIKDAGKNIVTGQTSSVVTGQPFSISLTGGEWKVIGNPFDFEIPLQNVYDQDTVSVAGSGNFYAWEGDWVQATKLEPWRGYIYKSAGSGQLFVNPRKANGGTAKIVSREIASLEEDEWLIDISARNGVLKDTGNRVGVLRRATDTYDDWDRFEPPTIPGGISLRIDNRDWAENGDLYATDIRTVNLEGRFWDLELVASDVNYNVNVTFDGLEGLPAEFDVFLVDVSLGIAKNLRWQPGYQYAIASENSTHQLRLLAGTREFVQENNAGVDLYPESYSLSQNFPNPFNPKTTILIAIEEDAYVDLVIYNLLGEVVRTMASNELLPSGYYNFIWQGKNNNGERVASGIYFYTSRIKSPDGKMLLNKTRKMILVK